MDNINNPISNPQKETAFRKLLILIALIFALVVLYRDFREWNFSTPPASSSSMPVKGSAAKTN